MSTTPDSIPFGVVGIIGLGLMGGSLARAIRRLPRPPRLLASDRDGAALEQAAREGVIDDPAEPDQVAASAELLVLATPVGAAVELLEKHHGELGDGAVATDLASVKRPVMQVARSLGLAGRFVGGHPVAGDHRGGFGAARPELFDGARVWLTPLEAPVAAERVAAFWRAVGARPEVTDPETHDALMAWVSHLPQLAASAMGTVLARSGTPQGALGPGGRDATRLAASPPALWTEILMENADLLARPVAELRYTLAAFDQALRDRDAAALAALLEQAARWAEQR